MTSSHPAAEARTLALTGTIDSGSLASLRQQVQDLKGESVTIDLSHVPAFRPGDLSALVVLARALDGGGHSLSLQSADPFVRRTFELVGLARLLSG